MIKKHWKKIVLLLVIILITASIYILNTIGVLYLKPDENTNQEKEALGTKKFTRAQLVTYNGDQFYSLYDVATTDTTMEIFAIYNLNSSCAQESLSNAYSACYFSSSQFWSGASTNINNVAGGDTSVNYCVPRIKKYALDKGAIKGRLLTYEEAVVIRDGSNDDAKNMLWGKLNTGGELYYYLGTSYSSGENNMLWRVNGRYSSIEYTGRSSYSDGARPVLTVLTSQVTAAS